MGESRRAFSGGWAVRSAGVSEVVVVTGSSSGIGRAVAERFASDGARVIVNSSRSVEEGETLARSLSQAVYVQGDLSREEDAQRLVATALERFGRLDVVVNNAGTTKRLPFADLDGADVLALIRAQSDLPVVIATARDDDREVVRLLDAGADDYLVKPFSAAQAMARIRAVLRRTAQAEDD